MLFEFDPKNNTRQMHFEFRTFETYTDYTICETNKYENRSLMSSMLIAWLVAPTMAAILSYWFCMGLMFICHPFQFLVRFLALDLSN